MLIYFDHNATTPLDERVLEAMLPYQRALFGNPSSTHRLGRAARAALDRAREQVAALVNTEPAQVVFTSGGTEANNLAIQGAAAARAGQAIAVSTVEHPSVLEPAARLERQGRRVLRLPVDSLGRVKMAGVDEALTHEVGLLSMMLANNETGVLQPVAAAAEQAHRASTWTHCDAVQAAGKVPVDFQALGVDLLTLSAHKLNGPKGVGALVVRGGVPVEPILYGGGQERGLRCGTENVAGIVGFGAAAELAGTELQTRMEAVRRLRAQLEEGLRGLAEVTLVAAEAERLPNTVLFTASGVEGGTLLMQLDRDGIAASGGSACDSHAEQPSHVLQAMGLEPGQARSAVRVSFGPRNTPREVDALLAILARVFERQRRVAASWA